MGFDMSYQAIPAESDLIERARQDESVGDLLAFVPSWFRDGYYKGAKPWPEADRLCEQLSKLASQHPGLSQRNCSLDRRWDWLHFLLSATRRNEPASNNDILFDKAVRGDFEIAPHVRASQGIPVKYVAPPDVHLIALLLEPMTPESLRSHYSPEKMEAAGVYKYWADRATEDQWRYIAECFARFRTFYMEAARHKEAVIVCLD